MTLRSAFIGTASCAFFASTGSGLFAQSLTEGWEGYIGLGLQNEATFSGSDETDTTAGIEVDLTWNDRFFIRTDTGIGGYVLNANRTGGDLSLGFALGLDGSERLVEDDSRLAGLKDIDASAAFRGIAEYELGPADLEFVLSRAIGSSGHEGTTLEVSAGFDFPLSERTFFTVSPFLVWGNSTYTNALYGVSGSEAAASSFGAYSAGSGIERVGIEIGVAHFITDRFGLFGQAEYGALQGDAGDSPIVFDKSQVELTAGVLFRF